MKKIVGTAALLLGALVSAQAAYTPYTYSAQGVNFTFTQTDDDSFTLRVQGAPDATGNWAPATHLANLGFKSLGVNFSSSAVYATLSASPAGAPSVWHYLEKELNGKGCGAGGGNAVICFTAVPPLALTSDMLFTVDIVGAPLALSPTLGPELKVGFSDAQGNLLGDLLSKNMVLASAPSSLARTSRLFTVPEPSGLALVGAALLAAGLARRR